MDDYFPELTKLFSSMGAKGLWALLEQCPFPQDVLSRKIATLRDMLVSSSRKKAWAAQKAAAVHKAARESIGLKQIGSADRYRIKMYVEEVKRTERMMKDIKQELRRVLQEIPNAPSMCSLSPASEPFRPLSFWENRVTLRTFRVPGRS